MLFVQWMNNGHLSGTRRINDGYGMHGAQTLIVF